jgi:hypothetical protein
LGFLFDIYDFSIQKEEASKGPKGWVGWFEEKPPKTRVPPLGCT